MASQKQIDANRRNAQKSTGPKTPEGKARVARNALRHGLTAEVAVTYGEDENAYTDFQSGFCNHHQPQGPVEEHLVQEIATAAWRLRRMHIIETGVFDLRFLDLQERMEEDYEELSPHERTAMVYRDDTRGPNTLDALSRYQARAERTFYKALHELERLQALRGDKSEPRPSGSEDSHQSEPRPLGSEDSPSLPPAPTPVPSPQPADPLPLAAQNDFCQTNPNPALGRCPDAALPAPPPCISGPATPAEIRNPG